MRKPRQADENDKALAPSTSKAIAPWQQERAEEAAKAKEQLAGIGGLLKSIGTKAGIMRIGDAEVPDGQLAVVVLGFVCAKSWYGDIDYQEGDKRSPLCYAFGDKYDGMAPHEKCKSRQNETCKGCKWDVFGTARTGNGKACRDHLRLLLVEAGTLRGDSFTPFKADDVKGGDLYTISVPPTSQVNFKTYCDGLAAQDLPTSVWGTITKIKVKPHAKKQVEVLFSELPGMDEALWQVAKARRAASLSSLSAPYPETPDDAKKAAKPAKKGAKKKFA